MSLSISMPKACAISCAMRGQPTRGLRRLNSTIASMSSFDGPFGPGAPMTSRREKPPIFAFLERLVELQQGSGLRITASLGIRLAGTKKVTQDPGEGDRTNSDSVPIAVRDLSVPKTPSIRFAIAGESEHD